MPLYKMDKGENKMVIDDIFVKENRILLPLMLERSMSISSKATGKAADELFQQRKGGQSPIFLEYNCSESWTTSFESMYGFNHKINRHFKGDGGIANQATMLVYDEKLGKQVLVPKAPVAYFLDHLAHNNSHDTVLQIYITGHTDCGGIKAVQGDYSKEALALRNSLDSLKIAISERLKVLQGQNLEPKQTYVFFDTELLPNGYAYSARVNENFGMLVAGGISSMEPNTLFNEFVKKNAVAKKIISNKRGKSSFSE